jgi:hypothetical protein
VATVADTAAATVVEELEGQVVRLSSMLQATMAQAEAEVEEREMEQELKMAETKAAMALLKGVQEDNVALRAQLKNFSSTTAAVALSGTEEGKIASDQRGSSTTRLSSLALMSSMQPTFEEEAASTAPSSSSFNAANEQTGGGDARESAGEAAAAGMFSELDWAKFMT